jgi:hypothetical protein
MSRDREYDNVGTVERVVVGAALVLGLAGCGGTGGGASSAVAVPEGGSSPEQAVETFLDAVVAAQASRAAGEFTEADRAYNRMAAVFGTENGSIRRSYAAEEVRSRMLVLSACLRPNSYRIITQPDPEAWQTKRTTVTVDLVRGSETLTLPFRLVLGRDDRWFIDQIEVSQMSC